MTETTCVKQHLGNDLWVETVCIADLKEQDVNAHVMTPATFERLVENIRRRGKLESLPYCAQPQPDAAVEIVSGHHRVRAARKAGLTHVEALIDRAPMTRSQIVAKQLAHNAIIGSDDADLVKHLLTMITSVDDLLETGLDPTLLPTPDKFKVTLFTPHADYKWQTATFVFLKHQLAAFDELIKSLKPEAKTVCVACEDQFEPFAKAVAAFARERNILSAASAVATLTDLALAQARELAEQREAAETAGSAPMKSGPLLSQLFGTARIPADAAEVIRQAIDKMIENKDVDKKAKWLSLERWAADYLSGA